MERTIHTIHLKLNQETLLAALDACIQHPDLQEPTTLTAAARTCMLAGIQMLSGPGWHNTPPSQAALQVYDKLSRITTGGPTQLEAITNLRPNQSQRPTQPPTIHLDEELLEAIPPASQQQAQVILNLINDGHLTLEDQLESDLPGVANITRQLIQPILDDLPEHIQTLAKKEPAL